MNNENNNNAGFNFDAWITKTTTMHASGIGSPADGTLKFRRIHIINRAHYII